MYFNLGTSENLYTIGSYPQISQTENNIFNSPFSTQRINYGNIPNEIPYLELEFYKNAKITDMLSSTTPYFGLIINVKLKNLLEQFNIPKYKFYPIVLFRNKINVKDYYWFNFYDDIFQYIDMKKSKFILKWRDVIEEFCFTSKEFYLSKDKKTFEDFETELIIKEVYLLNSFPQYDIFHFEGRNIISEKLLNAFIENNITGYEVSEYNVLKME